MSLKSHSCHVAFISDDNLTFMLLVQYLRACCVQSGVGYGCFSCDDSDKICGVLCGISPGLRTDGP